MKLFSLFKKQPKIQEDSFPEEHQTYAKLTELQDTLAGKMKRIALLKKAEDRKRELEFLDRDYKWVIEEIEKGAAMGFLSIDSIHEISQVLKEKLEGEEFILSYKGYGQYYYIRWA